MIYIINIMAFEDHDLDDQHNFRSSNQCTILMNILNSMSKIIPRTFGYNLREIYIAIIIHFSLILGFAVHNQLKQSPSGE